MAERKDKTIIVIKKFIDYLKKEGIKINKVYLYGSYASKESDEFSDIDIAVVSPDFTENRYKERLRLMKIASKIDKRIEPVPFRPEDFNDNDPLVWEIKNKGKIISSV